MEVFMRVVLRCYRDFLHICNASLRVSGSRVSRVQGL